MAQHEWSIQRCTVADAAALGENNASAFWTDGSWRQMWPLCTLSPFVVEQVTKRLPRNLLTDRAKLRHQKAVDPATGEVVGYARWILPPSRAGDEWWPEAQVPDVGDDEKAAFGELAGSAWWHFRGDDTPLDIAMGKIKDRMLAEREYMVLDYLAVHPKNWRKGIGRVLVASGLSKAKELDVDVFVLAFKAGYRVYEGLGLIEVDRVVEYDPLLFPGGDGEYGAYFFVSKVYAATEVEGKVLQAVEAEVRPIHSEGEAAAVAGTPSGG